MCSHHVSIEPTIQRSVIIEVEEKPIEFPSLWNGGMDVKNIRSNRLDGTDQRSCSF